MYELYKSGTTVLAFKYKDGVIVAGDRRMTSGHYHVDDYVKVEDVDNLTLIACAGTVSCIQLLIQTLVSNREWLEDHMVGKPIYIDGQSELLANILKRTFLWGGAERLWLDFIAIPILAGFDPNMGQGRVFGYDVAGMINERPDYVAVGSGQVNAETLLEKLWNPSFNLEDAQELAIDAVTRASADIHTSPPVLAPPTIFYASKDGIGMMDEKKALEVAWSIFYKDAERRGLGQLTDAVLTCTKEVK